MAQTLAGYGVPRKAIAKSIGIDPDTLNRHYQEDLESGDAIGLAQIGKSLFDQGVGRPAEYDDQGRMIREELKPDKSVSIFLGKVRLGFQETSRHELTGAGGGPIQTSPIDLSILTTEELQLLSQLHAKAKARREADAAASS